MLGIFQTSIGQCGARQHARLQKGRCKRARIRLIITPALVNPITRASLRFRIVLGCRLGVGSTCFPTSMTTVTPCSWRACSGWRTSTSLPPTALYPTSTACTRWRMRGRAPASSRARTRYDGAISCYARRRETSQRGRSKERGERERGV